MAANRLPLEGVTIADFSWVLAGPRATSYLGAMGAKVIKIEGPYRPDQFRAGPTPTTETEDYSMNFWILNYSKLDCTVDIMQPKGRELALEIIKHSDVVIENYAYGVMEKAGLTYEDIRKVKPDIIMVSGSALGKSGPDKGHVTYGALLHAFCGLNAITGYEGEQPGTLGGTYTDPLTGITFVMAILVALWHKRRTGRGQFIDTSMAETSIAQIPEFFLDYTVNGRLSGPQGNSDGRGAAPHNSYPCSEADSWLAIAVSNQQEWESFCQVTGSPEWTQDPRFRDQFGRWKHRAALDVCVAGWTRAQKAYEAMYALQEAGVAAAVCQNNKAVLEDTHLNARGYYVELEHERVGKKPIMRTPWLFEPGPNGQYFPAPLLGQDNDVVFRDILGLSDEQLSDLRASKVIL